LRQFLDAKQTNSDAKLKLTRWQGTGGFSTLDPQLEALKGLGGAGVQTRQHANQRNGKAIASLATQQQRQAKA